MCNTCTCSTNKSTLTLLAYNSTLPVQARHKHTMIVSMSLKQIPTKYNHTPYMVKQLLVGGVNLNVVVTVRLKLVQFILDDPTSNNSYYW